MCAEKRQRELKRDNGDRRGRRSLNHEDVGKVGGVVMNATVGEGGELKG